MKYVTPNFNLEKLHQMKKVSPNEKGCTKWKKLHPMKKVAPNEKSYTKWKKLHQMKKKYTKLNNEIFYTKLLIKKNQQK